MPNYMVQSRIGSGGFGEVYVCIRDSDGKEFALKRLAAGATTDDEQRFSKEVHIISKLDHPNVIRVVDFHLQKKPYWYVMPLCEKTLADEIPSLVGQEQRIRKIFGAVLDAIEYAHSANVIHRDLKPDNILMNGDDEVVVTDFGLGRMLDAESTRQTATGFGMGTQWYMAPEQYAGMKTVDGRADIFALGRILYALHAGPISSAINTSKLPGDIELVVVKATKPDPRDRFQSASELKATWLSITGQDGTVNDYSSILELVAEIHARGSMREVERDRILAFLAQNKSDGDVVHDVLMKFDGEMLRLIHEVDPDMVRALIGIFVEYCTSRRWSFSYTDDIGNACRRFYYATEDYQIRSALIHCACAVGYWHNRWHVIGICRDLLAAPKVAGEGFAICQRIEKHLKIVLRQDKDNYSMPKLDKHIQELFKDE